MKKSKPAKQPTLKKLKATNLAGLLRHWCESYGLDLGQDGFARTSDVLAIIGLTIEEISRIVDEDVKSRYTMITRDGVSYIRANQGHSDEVCQRYSLNPEEMFKPLDEKQIKAYHGTSHDAWEKIKEKGLKRMGRGYTHLSTGLPGDPEVKSGMRKNCGVILEIDLIRAKQDGTTFYESDNNVILTQDNINLSCIRVVVSPEK